MPLPNPIRTSSPPTLSPILTRYLSKSPPPSTLYTSNLKPPIHSTPTSQSPPPQRKNPAYQPSNNPENKNLGSNRYRKSGLSRLRICQQSSNFWDSTLGEGEPSEDERIGLGEKNWFLHVGMGYGRSWGDIYVSWRGLLMRLDGLKLLKISDICVLQPGGKLFGTR